MKVDHGYNTSQLVITYMSFKMAVLISTGYMGRFKIQMEYLHGDKIHAARQSKGESIWFYVGHFHHNKDEIRFPV